MWLVLLFLLHCLSYDNFQLPQMNPFPQDRSVLILGNCAIHKSAALREVIEAKGECNLLSIVVLILIIIRMYITFSPTLFTRFEPY